MSRKALCYILFVTGGILVGVVAGVVLLLATESGSRWLIRYGASSALPSLTVKRLEGSLLTTLKLSGIACNIDGERISINRMSLDLKPFPLFRGTLHLQNLRIKEVRCVSSPSKGLPSIDAIRKQVDTLLPVKLIIDDGQLDGMVCQQGDQRYLVDRLDFVGQVAGHRLKADRLRVTSGELVLELKGNADLAGPFEFNTRLNWETTLPNGSQMAGHGALSGDMTRITLQHELQEPHFVTTRGDFLLERSGSDSFDLDFTGKITGYKIPPTQIRLEAKASPSTLTIDTLIARTLGGRIVVSGNMTFLSLPQWTFTVSGSDIDPGTHWPQWHGNLAFDGRLVGRMDTATPILRMEEMEWEGRLFDRPFGMKASLALAGNDLNVYALKIRSGKNRLDVSGSAAEQLDLHFRLDAAEPASLWPGLEGSLTARGVVKGSRRCPLVSLTMEGDRMRYGDYRLGALEGKVLLDLEEVQASNGHFRLEDLTVSDKLLSDVGMNWAGNFKDCRLDMNLRSPDLYTQLVLTGGCKGERCDLRVVSSTADFKRNGKWRLQDPFDVRLTHRSVEPFQACWLQKKGSHVCLRGSWDITSGWRLEGDTDAPAVTSVTDLIGEVFDKQHLNWTKDTTHE